MGVCMECDDLAPLLQMEASVCGFEECETYD